MEPALAESVITTEATDASGFALEPEGALATSKAPLSFGSKAWKSAFAVTSAGSRGRLDPVTGTAAGTTGNLVVSTDLADAERVVAVQDALASEFAAGIVAERASTAGPETADIVQIVPHVRTGRRAARYRMSRPAKRKLLDGFCGVSGATDEPRTLLVVAHPDDESIGCGSRLARLGEAWVAYTTNGSPRNPAVARRFSFDSPEEYAEQRYREAMAALALAGVDEERVRWLGFDDGEASRNLVDLCLRVAELLDTIRPRLVITHPYEGGHTDHDATAFAVHLACGVLRREGLKPPAVFELTSYNAMNGERVVQEFLPHQRADLDARLLKLDRRERELKRRMFACFTTQQRVLGDFDPAIEKFRPAPRYVFTKPPHAGVLNYERYGDPALGQRFREAADQAMRELRLRQRI